MYQSDLQSTSVTHIQVPSSSKDEKNVPASNLDTSSNQTKDAKNDSLERFRQFHQLRRENQTARLRQLQALEDQLTGAATNNQQRQRSLLNTRGDARLRTTSLIHDNRLPKLVLSDRSSDDSDIRGPRANKSHNSWSLSNVEELVERTQIDGLEKRKTQDNLKRDSQSYLQANMIKSQKETPNRSPNLDRIPADSRKRNTLQDLERLIAESAQRLTESRKSIDELIQTHEVDTTKKVVDEKENTNFDHHNIENHEEEMLSTGRDHEKIVFGRVTDPSTDLVQANNSGDIGLRQKTTTEAPSNGASNLTHVRNRSLAKSKATLSSEHSLLKPSSEVTPDMSTEFTSKEEKEKSLLQAPLEPSQNSLSSVSPLQAKLLDINDNEQMRLSDDMQVTAIKQVETPQAASPKLHRGDGRSSLRKPQPSKTNYSSSNIKDEMTNAWLSSHNDVFGSDLSETSGRGAIRQSSSFHDDATTISQRSNISRASTTSSSSAWTNSARSIATKKQSSPSRHQRMISQKDFSTFEQKKASDSEEEALIRVAKPSRKSKTLQSEVQLTGSPGNPFRQSLRNSPSVEQLVRTKKVSIIQAPAEHSKVMESMHGSLAARGGPAKSTSSAPGQRKRGKVIEAFPFNY